jgi:hypothetical protein
MFWKLDLFAFSGEGREATALLDPLERTDLNHWTPYQICQWVSSVDWKWVCYVEHFTLEKQDLVRGGIEYRNWTNSTLCPGIALVQNVIFSDCSLFDIFLAFSRRAQCNNSDLQIDWVWHTHDTMTCWAVGFTIQRSIHNFQDWCCHLVKN